MIRRTCAGSTNMRQNRFATAIGAIRFAAIDAANASPSSEPIVPTGPAVAALLIRHKNSGRASAMARKAGASAASMLIVSARSQTTKRYFGAASAAPLARPMPVTAKPPASSVRASASPRPRDTPVTMAVFMRCSTFRAPLAMAAERERDDQNDDDGEDEQGNLDPALGIFAGDDSGKAVHDCLKRPGAKVIAEQPHRRKNVLEGLPGIVRADVEVAIGVARNLRGAHLTE